MDTKPRCQSCGMPLGQGFYGISLDGTESQEFCKFCFQNGSFTQPDLTVDQMIALSVANMTQDLKMPADQAQNLAQEVIPQLKRWQIR